MKNLFRKLSAEKHTPQNTLRDVILGGQDGLVNVLGVVLGVSAVTSDKNIIIATGLAATFAESISMAAVAYTSFLTERDYYQKEFGRELREIRETPDLEKEEIRQIYAQKGFSGNLLEEIVETISKNKRVWLNVMMSEELHLKPIDISQVRKTALIVGSASLIGSLIPLTSFFFLPHNLAFVFALIFSALALFLIGVYQAKTLVGDWKRSGLQMVLIGVGAALIGFLIAKLFNLNY